MFPLSEPIRTFLLHVCFKGDKMEIVKLDDLNKNMFQQTYITALEEGFVDFVPKNMIKNLNNNFQSCFEEICENGWSAFLCFEADIPIGVLVFGKSNIENANTTDAILDAIYFRKDFHGKGFAQMGFNFIQRVLLEQNFEKLFLWCSIENKRAWRFYEKNGFKQTKQKWNDELDGKIFHNILLCKDLK